MDWKEKYLDMLFPFNASDARTEVAYFIKYQNLPSHLYKYREVNEYAKSNLRDGTVWLADPESLNDPYDCAHAIDHIKLSRSLLSSLPTENLDRLPDHLRKEFAQARESNTDPTDELLARAMETVPNEKREALARAFKDAQASMFEKLTRDSNVTLKGAFKLCSFSERVDSILMWSHYANYHKGFCIEYDIRSVSPDSFVSRFMHPVIYSDKLLDLTEYFSRSPNDPEFHNLYANRIGLHKASDWAYEREWRLLIANGLLDRPQAFSMPKPTHVYLGSRMNPSDEDEMVEICSEIGVQVSRMHLSSNAHRMESVSLEPSIRKDEQSNG